MIISPKRQLEDFMSPKHASMMRAAQDSQQTPGQKTIREQALRAAGTDKMSAGSFVAMGENLAIAKLPSLDNKVLADVAQMAYMRGRTQLAKAAKKLCATRGIPLVF